MVTLNTSIRGAQIETTSISGGHLSSYNTPSDGDMLTWSDEYNQFKWYSLNNWIINETPFGDIDDSNKIFTLSYTPIEFSEQVYVNGMLLESGAENDYTITSDTITLTDPLLVGDEILVSYLVGTSEVRSSLSGPGSDYGYTVGGTNAAGTVLSTIDRITFPFDSGTATTVGTLSTIRANSGGCNSSNYGYIMTGSVGGYGYVSVVDRILFPFDSGTASHVGNLSYAGVPPAAYNSSMHGFCCYGSINSYTVTGHISRITFPFDSGTGTYVGTGPARHHPGGLNSSFYGFSCGGYGGGNTSIIDRVLFPFDSGTATQVGGLSTVRLITSTFNSSNYGYTATGYAWMVGQYSIIDRILFPFDSGTAIHVGNFYAALKERSSGCNSSFYGYNLGGGPYYSGTCFSDVGRITFPFDSGTATYVGNLTGTRGNLAGLDGTDFVSLFI
jgi:hypothetical protein